EVEKAEEAHARVVKKEVEAKAETFRVVRDRRWQHILELAGLQDEYFETEKVYEVAKRRARAVGVEHRAVLDMVVLSRGSAGDWELRQAVDKALAALKRGL